MASRGGAGGGRRGGRGRGDAERLPPSASYERGSGERQPPTMAYGRGGGRGVGRGAPLSPGVASSSAASVGEASVNRGVSELSLKEPAEVQTGMIVREAPLPPSTNKAIRFPARKQYGTVGKPCVVRANHFLVEVADKDLFHYDVAISPEASRGVNRALIAELVRLYRRSLLGGRLPAFDGRKNLYTAGELPFVSKDFVIKLPERDPTPVSETDKPRRQKEFKVVIKQVGRADVHNLLEFLKGRQFDTPQDTIQALDVVLRQTPSSQHTIVGRSFFSLQFENGVPLGDGVECWKGYYQSLRPTQMGLSLNLDIAATSFYKGVLVMEFASEYLNIRDFSRPLDDRNRIKLRKGLRGVRVETTYSTNRFKITDITRLPVEKLTFPIDEEGNTMSVLQYYKQRYNMILKYPKLPCLQSGNDARVKYLPIEVCKIVPGQRYGRKLNERQVTAILRASCKRPQQREKSIFDMVRRNNYNNDVYASEFGLRISSQMVSVEARVLPPPTLKYHESGKDKLVNPQVGQWNMMGKKMVNGARVDHWTAISFSGKMPQDGLVLFCNDLISMCNSIGMTINPRPCIPLQVARVTNPNSIDSALRNIHQVASKAVGIGRLQLLIIILPDMSGSYGKIKKICDTELGIVSQCLQFNKLAKGDKQYQENVALKINVKVGGRNTVLNDALNRGKRIPYLTDMPTIIFGADVTHPPPGEDSSPSIAAVVASMDWPEVTKYKGLISSQTHRKEMISNLYTVVDDPKTGKKPGGMIRELLISFHKATGHKPSRMIFYRDGVSEGQFSEVLLYEVDQIRKACASIQEDYQPHITFIVVQKRHHTRLFPEVHGRNNMTDRSGNILPGTVVDRKICHPTEFDFYLCSHAGIQGTSRPTHYHVLYDDNNFTADGLQTLTNNLCYTYARCTRSVSIVPPAYYAHLAAFRAKYYMEADQHESASSDGDRNREMPVEICQVPQVKDNVKEVMFYC